jgi:hypothetical protein
MTLPFEWQLLIGSFVAAFCIPCSKLLLYNPLMAFIYAKERLAAERAKQKAERLKAEEAAEAKRLRDEELAEGHRRRHEARELLRARQKAARAWEQQGKQDSKQQGKKRMHNGALCTEWDPHGFKHRKAATEGRLTGKRRPKDERKVWELERAEHAAQSGNIAALCAEALNTAPPPVSARVPRRPGHERTKKHSTKGEGSSAYIFHADEVFDYGHGSGGRRGTGKLPPLRRVGRGKVVPQTEDMEDFAGGLDEAHHDVRAAAAAKRRKLGHGGGSKKEKALARHVARNL